MNKFRFFSIFTILVVFSFQAYSQGYISLHFGPSFSMGDFGDDDIDDDDAGLAGTGFGAGLKYVYPLTDNGLGLFGGLDVILNPIAKDAQDDIEDFAGSTSEFTFPKYINLPISAGLDYTFKANDQVSLFGQAGISLSLLKMTDFIWEEEGDDDYEEKYDLSTTLGFNIGGGLIINDKVEIGLKYFGLGEHDMEGEYEYGTDDGKLDDYNQKVSLFMLTLGFRL
ncbi:MAG: hypothetical protein K9H64_06955 [Bacteroidales bacterium]|nr:hypothetical protein [Bacteroidales bacterium]MCF8455502.1 hypothetical protein [Bacteroidales bacterium]